MPYLLSRRELGRWRVEKRCEARSADIGAEMGEAVSMPHSEEELEGGPSSKPEVGTYPAILATREGAVDPTRVARVCG